MKHDPAVTQLLVQCHSVGLRLSLIYHSLGSSLYPTVSLPLLRPQVSRQRDPKEAEHERGTQLISLNVSHSLLSILGFHFAISHAVIIYVLIVT